MSRIEKWRLQNTSPPEWGLATAKAWAQMLASKRVLKHFHSEKEEVQLFPYLEILVVFSLDKEMHTKNPIFLSSALLFFTSHWV